MGFGGNENVLAVLANFFHRKDIQVHYIIVYNLKEFQCLEPGIKVYKPKLKRKGVGKIKYNFLAFRFVRKTVNSIKPDVILSYGEHLNSYILLSLLFTPYPHYISDTGSPNLHHSFIMRVLKKNLYPQAAGVIAQTNVAAEQKRKLLGNAANIRVIPTPARMLKMYPTIARENYIVYTGRLHIEKGVDNLIEIFSQIPNKENWKLLITGSGLHEQLFRSQVDKLNMQSKICFLGIVDNLDKLLAKCKIFVLASHAEGFPTSVLEALCAGLPVISYDCVAGPSEMIVDNENGFLIPVGDKTTFANKLSYLMNNEKERTRLGKNAEKVYEKFKLEVVGQQYLDFLLENSKPQKSKS